ncbi:hypothetical protein [Parasphingorhabdus sp.]|uniref:hypothetical protein n=1 Tax=Parasphingorhabdus sp. TaxID=2709688 RepID=UPI003263F2FE
MRILSMGNRPKTPKEIFASLTIGLSLALTAGLALGHVTQQSMHSRLSASPPAEPARKIDRLRLERLQAWTEQSFGVDRGYDDQGLDYAEPQRDDYAPIDVGAVSDAPGMAGMRASGV